MSEMPDARDESVHREHQKPLGDNALLQLVQQPRMLLILLAAWAIASVVLELLAGADISLGIDGGLDGLLAGRVLSFQALPLAVLYLFCARDPARYPRIFWLALVDQGAAVAANVYHFAADHLEFEAIFIPLVVSATLALLAFLNVFQRNEPEREYA